ncbi:nematocyst expressed protein 6-like [Tubulanus polymorphus]|uniref:nematocyst expressed protein 6-like n=1 Tax=Tubulanus polymorphus TaxID=672921 RepID=UPI003DA5CE45
MDRVIPYRFHDHVNETMKSRINEAMTYIQTNTCITFVPKNADHVDYIEFWTNESICASELGRAGGEQQVQIGEFCQVGNVMHELMHVLGFFHEHVRPDRDDYVNVLMKNIKDGKYYMIRRDFCKIQ